MTPIASQDLLRNAVEWRLIALLLERPTDDWTAQVDGLKREVADEQLRCAADAATAEASIGLYDTTFGPGGPAAPREVTYRACLDGNFLAELCALYNAFAYQPNGDYPPDHVAVQVNFVAYLRLKQAYAVSRGDHEQGDIAARAAERVVEDHLSLIAQPLARSLAASGVDYLARTSAGLLKRVGEPRRRQSGLHVLDNADDGVAGCDFDADELPASAP